MFFGGIIIPSGGIPDIERVYHETRFDEILIAHNEQADEDLSTLQCFASARAIDLRRYHA